MELVIVVVMLLATVAGAIGFGRSKKKNANVADWALGGRSLGALLFWFMNAGEVYTTFAVLGISGYAWAMGAPAYLAFCSVSLSYSIGYWLMPKIWRAGRMRHLVTQADFFAARYSAPWLGVLAGVVGIGSLIVYVQIQLISLGLIVSLTLGGQISPTLSIAISGLIMIAFVMFAGLRSAAFAAAVKDVLMLLLVGFLCVTIASRVGAASMFDVFRMAEEMHPGFGKLPGIDPTAPTTAIWLMTSALNVALGNWVFPHLFQVSYTANSATTIRRNAIWQPIYSLSFFFIILLGFAALVAGTQPPDGNLNAAFLQFVSDKYPAWVVGVVAGTGFLLALAPGSVLLLTASSVFSRNVLLPLRPQTSDRGGLLASRIALVVFAAAAVWLALSQKGSLVAILLAAYSAIGMLAPGVFLGFLWRGTSAIGVMAGIVTGFVILLVPPVTAAFESVFVNWELGLVAMAVNFAVTIAVSLATRAPDARGQDVAFALSAADARAMKGN